MDKALFNTLPSAKISYADAVARGTATSLRTQKPLILKSASGHSIETQGIFNTTFNLGGKQVIHPVTVVDGLRTGAILGIDFLMKHGVTVDTSKKSISFNMDGEICFIEASFPSLSSGKKEDSSSSSTPLCSKSVPNKKEEQSLFSRPSLRKERENEEKKHVYAQGNVHMQQKNENGLNRENSLSNNNNTGECYVQRVHIANEGNVCLEEKMKNFMKEKFFSQTQTPTHNLIEEIMSPVKYTAFCSEKTTVLPGCEQVIRLKVRDSFGITASPGAQGILEDNLQLPLVAFTDALSFVDHEGFITTTVSNANTVSTIFEKMSPVGEFSIVQAENCASIMDILALWEEEEANFLKANPTKPASQAKLAMINEKINVGGDDSFKQAIIKLLCKYHDVVSQDSYDLGRAEVEPHVIKLRSQAPVHSKQFRIPWDHREFINNFVTELLKKKCLQPSHSPFNAPIFCVQKPHGGGLRVVQDFRALNSACLEDKYVMREVQDCIDEIGLRRSTVFSTIDLTSGFWQQPLLPSCRPYTAFTVPGRGRFEWVTMPMGLHGAPSSFSRLMDRVMRSLPGVLTYLDDVLVHSPTFQQHTADLEPALLRLRQFGLKINLSKCYFGTPKVNYLGFTLTPQGVLPGEEKLEAVKTAPPPCNVKQIKEFTGLTNYFRHLIPNYSLLAGQLTKLICKESAWEGGKLPAESLQAFTKLQNALCNAPVLAYPRPDKPMTLAADAATGDKDNPGGLGAALMQEDDQGRERVIAYASRALKTHEKNYGAYLLELAAASWAIDHFSVYLTGRKFTLLTDHKPLTGLNTRQTKTLNRLQQQLSEFNFIIKYKEGKAHTVPDYLSRNVAINAIEQARLSPALGVTIKQMRTAQQADERSALVLEYLENDMLPSQLRLANWVINISQKCAIIQGVLHVTFQPQFDHLKAVLWVPNMYKKLIFEAAHSHPFAGHGGQIKTMLRLKGNYWWPNMKHDVDKWIAECKNCQKCKITTHTSRSFTPLVPWPIATQPNERVHIDLMGAYKTSDKGNKFIMVMTDAFTKYVVVAAIPNKEAETVADTFFKEWISRFACPKILVSDNGKEFCNNIMDRICKLMHIERRKTSPYHPQTNSSAERFNRSAIKYMQTILDNATLDWEKWLVPLMLSYNTQVHKSTNLSPFFLTFQQDPRLPYFDMDINKPIYSDDWASETFLRTRKAWEQAKIHLTDARNLMVKQNENNEEKEKKSAPPLGKGQNVLLQLPSFPPGTNPKFHSMRTEGYTVICPVGPVTYALYNQLSKRATLAHISRIKTLLPVTFSSVPETLSKKFLKKSMNNNDEDTGVFINFPFMGPDPIHLRPHQDPHGNDRQADLLPRGHAGVRPDAPGQEERRPPTPADAAPSPGTPSPVAMAPDGSTVTGTSLDSQTPPSSYASASSSDGQDEESFHSPALSSSDDYSDGRNPSFSPRQLRPRVRPGRQPAGATRGVALQSGSAQQLLVPPQDPTYNPSSTSPSPSSSRSPSMGRDASRGGRPHQRVGTGRRAPQEMGAGGSQREDLPGTSSRAQAHGGDGRGRHHERRKGVSRSPGREEAHGRDERQCLERAPGHQERASQGKGGGKGNQERRGEDRGDPTTSTNTGGGRRHRHPGPRRSPDLRRSSPRASPHQPLTSDPDNVALSPGRPVGPAERPQKPGALHSDRGASLQTTLHGLRQPAGEARAGGAHGPLSTDKALPQVTTTRVATRSRGIVPEFPWVAAPGKKERKDKNKKRNKKTPATSSSEDWEHLQ